MRRPLAGDRPPILSPRLGVVILLGFAVVLGACQDRAPVVLTQFRAFGTQFELSLVGATPAQVERARADIAQALGALEREWSPHGEHMQRVNRLLGRGETFVPPPSVLRLIRLGQTIESETAGLVNLGSGWLTQVWGFTNGRAEPQPPPRESLTAWIAHVPSLCRVEINGLSVRAQDPLLRLDLTPIARAQAIDLGIQRLRVLGIRHALIQTPYERRALGERSGQPWWVPLLHPGGSMVLALVPLRGDEALATVAEDDRFFVYRGRRYHDILDPRTGQPASGLRRVVVLDQETTRATIAARALFIAGPDAWRPLARRLRVRYALLIERGGRVQVTAPLHARLERLDPSVEIEVVELQTP